MKYSIYIKGCHNNYDNSASLAFAVLCNGKLLATKSAKFVDVIPTKETNIPILRYKGQFQMEIYAIGWALSFIDDDDAVCVIWTNNSAVAGWIAGWEVPEDYTKMFDICMKYAKGKTITAEWIPKTSEDEWNVFVNNEAFQKLKI